VSASNPQKKAFSEVLERGASVDAIFKDNPAPRGSDPFGGEVPTINIDDSGPVEGVKTGSDQGGVVEIVDNDSLLNVNRKLAALEALFKLVGRDYFSFGQLVSEILRISMDNVKSEAGSFIEVDHVNQCLFFRAVTGRASENLLNFTFPFGQGIAGFVCETQQPMVLSSVDDSSVHLSAISNAIGFEAKNMLAYPLVIRGITFGCIEVLNRLGEPQYTEADKEVMGAIAEYAARVIEQRLVMATLTKGRTAAAPAPKKESGEDAA
jgi:GAF domain-containing protein